MSTQVMPQTTLGVSHMIGGGGFPLYSCPIEEYSEEDGPVLQAIVRPGARYPSAPRLDRGGVDDRRSLARRVLLADVDTVCFPVPGDVESRERVIPTKV